MKKLTSGRTKKLRDNEHKILGLMGPQVTYYSKDNLGSSVVCQIY